MCFECNIMSIQLRSTIGLRPQHFLQSDQYYRQYSLRCYKYMLIERSGDGARKFKFRTQCFWKRRNLGRDQKGGSSALLAALLLLHSWTALLRRPASGACARLVRDQLEAHVTTTAADWDWRLLRAYTQRQPAPCMYGGMYSGHDSGLSVTLVKSKR